MIEFFILLPPFTMVSWSICSANFIVYTSPIERVCPIMMEHYHLLHPQSSESATRLIMHQVCDLVNSFNSLLVVKFVSFAHLKIKYRMILYDKTPHSGKQSYRMHKRVADSLDWVKFINDKL